MPNKNFGVNPSQIYSEDQYQKFLEGNSQAIPREDYACKMREYRGTPGIIPHQEIELTDRIIRKDSYNGTFEIHKENDQQSLVIDKSEINNYSEIREEKFLDKSNLIKNANVEKQFIK